MGTRVLRISVSAAVLLLGAGSCAGGVARPATATAEVPRTAAAGSASRATGDVCADLADMASGLAALRQVRGDAIVLQYGAGLTADPARDRRLEAAAPGIAIGEFVVFEAILVGPRRFLPMPVQGRSPELLERLRPYAVGGDPTRLEDGSILLGQELAEALGVHRGESIGVAPLLPVDPLAPPPIEGTAAPVRQRPGAMHRFRVAATASFPANGILALDHDEVAVTLADAQRLWSESGAAPNEISGHVIHFPTAAAAPDGVARVREALSPDPFRVVPLEELVRGGEWTEDLVRRWCEGRR